MDPLVNLEQLRPSMDLPVQDPGDQRPNRMDPSETPPRQEPPVLPAGLSFRERSDSEEMPTYISENMTVTSADEEKLLLLNKNTELRQKNKELLALSQVWHTTYHSTRAGLQRQVAGLQVEMATLRTQALKLSRKLDHEQSRREYYERTLLQEVRHSRVLQEYVRQLEGRQLCSQRMLPTPGSDPSSPDPRACALLLLPPWEEPVAPQQCPPPRRSPKGKGMKPQSPAPLHVLGSKSPEGRKPSPCAQRHPSTLSNGQEEVLALKDQLEALKYQTEIYAAEYRLEQEDGLRVKAENLQLRKEEQELRQRVALLEEQLRVFEEDFQKERSDKQVLQRLLKRNAGAQGPVLLLRAKIPDGPPGAVPPPPRHGHGKNHLVCPQCNQRPPSPRDKTASFCRDF